MHARRWDARRGKHARKSWSTAVLASIVIAAGLLLAGPAVAAAGLGAQEKATGSVGILWQGNGQGAVEKTGIASFEVFEGTDDNGNTANGEFRLTVMNPDETVHRFIKATVMEAWVGQVESSGVVKNKACFIAVVVTDCRPGAEGCGCSGGEGGCSGGEGGCSGGEGGCSGGEGGCSGGEGGCGGDGGVDGHDGGCSGGEGGGSGSGGSGSGGSGSHVSGKDSRVGQLIVVKLHDGGTPGAGGDGISWKWFAEGSELNIEDYTEGCSGGSGGSGGEGGCTGGSGGSGGGGGCSGGEGGCSGGEGGCSGGGGGSGGSGGSGGLCKKTITSGNLVVHLVN